MLDSSRVADLKLLWSHSPDPLSRHPPPLVASHDGPSGFARAATHSMAAWGLSEAIQRLRNQIRGHEPTTTRLVARCRLLGRDLPPSFFLSKGNKQAQGNRPRNHILGFDFLHHLKKQASCIVAPWTRQEQTPTQKKEIKQNKKDQRKTSKSQKDCQIARIQPLPLCHDD